MSTLAELRKGLLERPSPKPSPSELRLANRASPFADSAKVAGEIYSVESGSIQGSINNREGHQQADQAVASQPGPSSEFASSVEKIFEPASADHETWAKVAKWSDSIEQVTRWVASGLEPMTTLCERLETLSTRFQPIRSFEQELAVMAKSFKPVEELHKAVEGLVDAFQGSLSRLAKPLEAISSSKRRIAELTRSLEAASELQTRFNKLSQTFGADRGVTASR
jgi:hypothetical protein